MAAPLKLVVLLFVVASAATFGFVQGSDLNLVSINDKANLLELIRKLNLSVFYDNVVKASLVAQLQAEGKRMRLNTITVLFLVSVFSSPYGQFNNNRVVRVVMNYL